MKCLDTLFCLLNLLVIKTVVSNCADVTHSPITIDNKFPEYKNHYTEEEDQENEVLIDSSSRITISDIVNNGTQKKAWYLAVPPLPILFATSSKLPEGKCKRQVHEYLEKLNNGTLWAVRMYDSSTKYPEGIIAGHTRHYGNFDECYQIETTSVKELLESAEVTETIVGKYCLVEIGYEKSNVRDDHKPYTLDFDPNRSAWEAIKEKGDFRRIRRYLLEFALCVPDACTESDVEKALEEPLRQMGLQQGLTVNTRVKGECQVQYDSTGFTLSAIIYCCTILGLFLMVGVSTWYDEPSKNIDGEKHKSLATNILQCFSARRNFMSFIEVTYSHQGLDCIELFRVLTMIMALYGHRMLQYFANPTMNSELVEYGFTVPFFKVFINGTIVVEVFFTIGGILRGYHMLRELDERKKMNLLSSIFTRYFRFTPSYLIIILFIAIIFPHLGSGPYWTTKVNLESSSCADNWWINILYINNYVNTDKLCMFQSWYIAVDLHLYILSSFVIYCFWRMPRKIGYVFLMAIICVGSSIPFYLSYFQNVPPMYQLYPYVHELKEDLYFKEHYIKTHERLTSYFVGVLGGAIIYYHNSSPWSIPKPLKMFPFIPGAFLLCTASVVMGLKFLDPNETPTTIEKASYATFGRLAMAIGIASGAVYMSVSDPSGIYHKFFKPRWVQPFAKLTYGVYLIHGIFQIYDIGVQRNARTYSTYNTLRDLVVDNVFSFFLAFILKLVVEEPFRKMEKLITAKSSYKPEYSDKKDTMSVKKLM